MRADSTATARLVAALDEPAPARTLSPADKAALAEVAAGLEALLRRLVTLSRISAG